jgi:hypothetical protein
MEGGKCVDFLAHLMSTLVTIKVFELPNNQDNKTTKAYNTLATQLLDTFLTAKLTQGGVSYARAIQYEINFEKFPRYSPFSFVISDDQEVMEFDAVIKSLDQLDSVIKSLEHF